MSNLERDLTLLLHMKNYCDEVIEAIKLLNYDFEEFEKNYIYRNSISMGVFQIGELANHLTPDFIENTNERINWKEIKGMRNRFAHGYLEMNHKVIFDTAIKDIPMLNTFLINEINKMMN